MPQAPQPRSSQPTSDPRATARAMFGRVLSAWAGDLLSLRLRGLDRPTYRRGAWSTAGLVGPSAKTPAEAA